MGEVGVSCVVGFVDGVGEFLVWLVMEVEGEEVEEEVDVGYYIVVGVVGVGDVDGEVICFCEEEEYGFECGEVEVEWG